MNDQQKVYLVYVTAHPETGDVETWLDSVWTDCDAAVNEADRVFRANENVDNTSVIEHVTDKRGNGENEFDYDLEKTVYTRTLF